MRVHGNLINRIVEHSLSPAPKVGDGLTGHMWSDRYAGTIVRVSPSGKTVWFTEDTAKVVSGSEFDGSAKYEFTPNPAGRVRVARKRKNGTWRSAGDGITIGNRSYYRDPHF